MVIDKENRHLIKDKTYGIHIKSSIEEICKRIEVSTRPLLYNTNKVLKITFNLETKKKPI